MSETPTLPSAAPTLPAVPIWATKGVAFWGLLAALLVRLGPESILELGGGRSTTFLADYGARHRKLAVTIEQSEVWHAKIVSDLAFMGLRRHHVHHVPLDPAMTPPWYEEARVRAILKHRAFDMVFVDGPQGEARRNRQGTAIVARAAREARLVIVDDVHRSYNDAVFRRLAARMPPDGIFYWRYGRNLLAIAAVAAWAPVVADAFEGLGLAYARSAVPEAAAA